MATRTKKHRIFEGEQDLLDFARSYLSEAFPNPERKGALQMTRSGFWHPTNTERQIG